MRLEFNTLYWTNTPEEQIAAHKSVTNALEIPVNYYSENTRHGLWMDRMCADSESDIIGFFDSDCIPLNKEKVMECVRYVARNKTFLGVAQVSNHIPPKSHIYAAPAFYLIHKECWRKLGTSFLETYRSDVGEEISYKAEERGIRYRCLYPCTFEREPQEGLWPLGNFGYYGIGTTFDNTVYHLYQGRMGTNLQLFIERCNDVVEDKFDSRFHISSKTTSYKGNIVP